MRGLAQGREAGRGEMSERITTQGLAARLFARHRAGAARARRLRILFAVLLPVAVGACAGSPELRQVDAEPVAERELPVRPGSNPHNPSPRNGQIALAQGVFRVHLSNIRCVRAPCPNGYMVSDIEGQPPALRPGVPQPVARMPEQVRFDAASGGAVPPGLVDQAHVGDGIIVEGRAWLIDGGRTLRVEVARLLDE